MRYQVSPIFCVSELFNFKFIIMAVSSEKLILVLSFGAKSSKSGFIISFNPLGEINLK